jgi:ssRNA-specific RNase YbeY (16S rRNA maturation enzyme)
MQTPVLSTTERIKMEVRISNKQKKHKISKIKIRKTAQAILNALDCPDSELSILIVDDQQI